MNSLSTRGELRGSPSAPLTGEHKPDALLERVPTWALATALTAVLGLVYVIAAPPSTDLAAAAYRSTLFSRVGFTLWDNSWYGGHHLPAYSLLAPALGAWLGPQLLNALAMVAATALFALLIDGCFPARATRIAAVWFAVGASFALLANRVPYDLGLALGLGALVVLRGAGDSGDSHGGPESPGRAVRRDRAARGGQIEQSHQIGANGLRAALGQHAAALVLAVLCAVASPVAGAFLALAGLAWTLTSRAANGWPRPWPVAFTLAALVPIGLLTLAFPEGGTQPFVASAFYPDIAAILMITALIVRDLRERRERVASANRPGGTDGHVAGTDPTGGDGRGEAVDRLLLAGALLYALALLGAYAIPSAVGGNVDRLGALLAGPVLACLLAPRHPRLLLLLAPLFLYWQLTAPLTDFASAASDPAVNSSYFTPLLGELRTLGVGYAARPVRIEVVPSSDHGEARWMAPHVMLARGWERQLDQQDGPLFYDEASMPLTPARYRAWLSENAVSYVALPDAPLDYSAKGEAKLLRTPQAYLREIWRSAHWRLFAVLDAAPLAQAPATLTGASTDSFTLSAPRPANTTVRIRFTPYWAILAGRGCVREAPGGWTEVQARSAGSVRVGIDFSLGRVFDHGPRCASG